MSAKDGEPYRSIHSFFHRSDPPVNIRVEVTALAVRPTPSILVTRRRLRWEFTTTWQHRQGPVASSSVSGNRWSKQGAWEAAMAAAWAHEHPDAVDAW